MTFEENLTIFVICILTIIIIIKAFYDYKHCYNCGKWINRKDLIRLDTIVDVYFSYPLKPKIEVKSYHNHKDCLESPFIYDCKIKDLGCDNNAK